jgi:hypothetical protein
MRRDENEGRVARHKAASRRRKLIVSVSRLRPEPPRYRDLIKIATRCVFMALALLTALAGVTAATQEALADQEAQILRAAFAEGRLWLLESRGRLSSIAEGGERIDVATPDPVIELFVQNGRVAIVTCPQECFSHSTPVERWTVRRRVGNGWEAVRDIATKGERFVAATPSTLLTDSRMIDLTGSGASETALTLPSSSPIPARPKPLKKGQYFRAGGSWLLTDSGTIDLDEGRPWEAAPPLPSSSPVLTPRPLRSSRVTAVLVTPKHVFVGYNAGEWGGGLQRIDRATGVVSDIDDVEGDLCGGKLNPACDPVNGIATIPWKPDCIAVAVGLIHMIPHGRIVEVCDNTVHLLYIREIQARPPTAPNGRDGIMWTYTSAFFGLQRKDGYLLAAAHDGLYQIGSSDQVQQIPLPQFKQANGVATSFDMPGLVLVLTTANQRFSLSGSTPILVPR